MDILEVKNISKSFKKRNVLKNISFSIKSGEIVGFVGPNGAGKTTTIKIISNLVYPDKGSVFICGYDVSKNREKAFAGYSAIIENPALYPYLSGYANINFYRKLRKTEKSKMDEIIDYIGLQDKIHIKVKKYSLGMKQRLALGISLLSNPKLLILDEPTNGLDPSGIIDLRKKLKDLSNENHTAMLISSHQLSEIEKICDRIIFINNGEIVSIEDNRENSEKVRYKFKVDNVSAALELLKDCSYVNKSANKDDLINLEMDRNCLDKLLLLFLQNKISFSDIECDSSSVEEEYSKLCRGENKTE